MAYAMALIAESAADLGVRSVVTFVGEDDIAALKGCKKAGFWPYTRRREIYRLGRRQVRYQPVPPGTPYPFDEQPSVAAPGDGPLPAPRAVDDLSANSAESAR